MTVFSDVKQWLLHLEHFLEMIAAEQAVALNTISAYKVDILGLISFLCSIDHGCNILDVITLQYLKSYVQHLAKQGLNRRTIARKISAIRQFCIFLYSSGVIKCNPAQDLLLPKQPVTLPKAIPLEWITMLLDTAYANHSIEGKRTVAILELLYATGMRISELLTLKVDNFERDIITHAILPHLLIRGKGGKERVIILNHNAITALEQYIIVRKHFIKYSVQTDWLFPSTNKSGQVAHLTRQRFGQLLKELAVNSGINPQIISPHKIRHSFATHMLQGGANLRVVQELLGHADISSTQIYTKVTAEHAIETIIEKHPLSKVGNL